MKMALLFPLFSTSFYAALGLAFGKEFDFQQIFVFWSFVQIGCLVGFILSERSRLKQLQKMESGHKK